ncbi:MAG TPA: ATP-binding protein [Gemmatimonadaceae bacterium]|nr:ATP-binding protein [Gemmatimonadaceae bacterium]
MSPEPRTTNPSDVARLRDALHESEARYAALVARAGYGVYRSTPEGRFLDANAVLVAMLGYASLDDLLALDLARDVYVDADERDRLRRRASTAAAPDWVETCWKRRDGSLLTVRLSVREVRADDGEVQWYDGLVEDITERQRHDELLRRSERMASIGTTLAGVAHELNNPLAAIMGFTQLLLKKPWPAEDRAALETINHEAIRSATIVKDLLALARRRDAGRRAPAGINDIVGYIARTRRYALETAGIACRLELDQGLPLVYGDRAQLEQVILNLMNNAEQALRAAMDEAPARSGAKTPEIVIRTRHEGAHVLIEVQDNGPGIPEAARSQIWDPFWTTKNEGEGTGLGLTVVHGIIAEHGGTISLENQPGGGARFVIRLPVAHDGGIPEPVGRAPRPLDVLIVDPGASDLVFVERFLTSRGHAVVNAGSGELAIRLASQTSFDAVVCDARLLGRDGVSVAATLRATSGCAHARFVLSGPEPLDVGALPDGIANAMLVTRPYDVEQLRRLIEGD